jgi:hypothetical protein
MPVCGRNFCGPIVRNMAAAMKIQAMMRAAFISIRGT